MSRYLKNLIAEGEHQHQDFKYCISDARKIARSFSAFANTGGGRLLVGVRDNGSIAGISDEEEYYMIESAASMYCKPEIQYEIYAHRTDSLTVLEINILAGINKPYLADNRNGKWLAYVRIKDQNLLANRVILKLWRIENDRRDQYIKFTTAETKLIDFLKQNERITLAAFKKLTGLKIAKAEWVLARLLSLGILDYELSEEGCFYHPSDIPE